MGIIYDVILNKFRSDNISVSVTGEFLKKDQTVQQATVGSFKFPAIETDSITSNAIVPADINITTGINKTLVLDTPVYEDIIISAYNLRPGSTPPIYQAFVGSIFGVAFVDGQEDIVYGSFEIPHSYKENTELEVHLHWSPSTANTGECVFNMVYTIADMGGTFSAEQPITFAQNGSGIINKHQYITGSVKINGGSIGQIVCFALRRNAGVGGDSFVGNAFLHNVGVHYQQDTLGSRKMGLK